MKGYKGMITGGRRTGSRLGVRRVDSNASSTAQHAAFTLATMTNINSVLPPPVQALTWVRPLA